MSDATIIRLDPQERTVTRGEVVARLSARETEVFAAIANQRGRIARNDDLIEMIDPAGAGRASHANLRCLVKKLRRKLAKVGVPDSVETVYGAGFRIRPGFLVSTGDELTIIGPEARDLVRRLVEQCSDSLLAAQVRQAVLHE